MQINFAEAGNYRGGIRIKEELSKKLNGIREFQSQITNESREFGLNPCIPGFYPLMK